MNRLNFLLILRNGFLCFFLLIAGQFSAFAQVQKHIVIETKNVNLIFTVNKGKLYQTYLGEKLLNPKDTSSLKASGHEAYIGSGTSNLFEPAIKVGHADGNPSLDLKFSGVTTAVPAPNVNAAAITLSDPKYPITVILHIQSYYNEDIIKTWTEIRHQEKKPVILYNYASSMLHFDAESYWLTQFHGDWAEEVKMEEAKLTSGIKVLESKLGTRANMYQSPFFFLSLNQKSEENTGELIAGTLAWTGNFKFLFEMDEKNSLRVVSGMNPFASEYKLDAGKPFVTPEFIFTYSNTGKGTASRNFHKWARNFGIMDGDKPRLTLLNNWEATYFDFNQQKLGTLFEDASKLGVDVFLLDDGWFGNKYPRNDDGAGLGDWQENKTKLPDGISSLVKDAESKGVKFGIWLEPEMVNPKSELYEKHPDWILKLQNREEHYYRNQLVLDLINPKVQDFVYDLVDGILTKSPGIAYIKWDCNRMMTNAYSPYLKDNQSAVYIEYTRSLYKVLERLRKKYPSLPMMLCSGGGGRTDYGALKYFTEFWPSDNTDGFERVFIQWGYSNFFPSFALSSHVTSWGKQSIKFRTDVAMMGKLGFDLDMKHLNAEERLFCSQAVQNYKRLYELIAKGDQYRIISPYDQDRAVVTYIDSLKSKAVLFAYNLNTRYGEEFNRVKLQGLDPQKQYKITETNLYNQSKSTFKDNNKTYSGDYLMKIGLEVSGKAALSSAVFEITSVN
ncbi:alpha-galactosidase [Pedobacter metabolipauper]|uniref:Alpha-galactosidase n=1 Tax=Pedobacter metabolipauper TaxID=425513 RepID=A0A4R6SYT7_9SPHI|nr:alpha-galactosidase [Pedobacter metabolipauper]TDQ11606.1 alpha-galactosidase [Pedobacter metabolipauper]